MKPCANASAKASRPSFSSPCPTPLIRKPTRPLARWIDEIRCRQTFDLRPWHDAGEQASQQAHVRQTLEQLHASVRERLDRAERSRSSPNNLIEHNPAFVGRVHELTEFDFAGSTHSRRAGSKALLSLPLA
jgi:hypothetical protein